jgi:hypothetical protein
LYEVEEAISLENQVVDCFCWHGAVPHRERRWRVASATAALVSWTEDNCSRHSRGKGAGRCTPGIRSIQGSIFPDWSFSFSFSRVVEPDH